MLSLRLEWLQSKRLRSPRCLIASTRSPSCWLRSENCLVINLLNDLPARADAESFTEVLSRKRVRIERIVSTGQFTPPEKPHRQGT